jgi:hypothetical protein
MTIWHLIISMCFSMSVAGAFVSAKLAKVGPGGWMLAMCVGSVIGICCAATMYYGNKILWTYGQRKPHPNHSLYAMAAYLAVIPWWLVTCLLGRWGSSIALRLIT